MKKITLLTMFLATFNFLCSAQEITLIDFGLLGQISDGNWNNVTDSSTLNTSTFLINSEGDSTGEIITLTDPFDDDINGFGTQSPDSSLPFGSKATRDNFFGESIEYTSATPSLEPTGGFTLTGLDANELYSFKIFASRLSALNDNREALYTITGDGGAQTALLDASNNTANVAAIFNVKPTATGEIIIQAEKGPNNDSGQDGVAYNFYYLGAIEMTKTETSLSTDSFSSSGLINIYPNPSAEMVNVSFSLKESARVKMDIYDVNGKFVKTILNEEKAAGSYIQKWNSTSMAAGLYILEISADNKKYRSKLILK
ncbi:T9SS type A sorting domain-containing protein [Algibacter mikhailovii]|uniref:T9SS type A sorting domain-containing protein n=1 Tax=Algibacter mikhailovii TaxID=425498 RepID=UPI00249577F2|nr:T9SS type A sorting domain-containing protein [Algibacter mikhailovii]